MIFVGGVLYRVLSRQYNASAKLAVAQVRVYHGKYATTDTASINSELAKYHPKRFLLNA